MKPMLTHNDMAENLGFKITVEFYCPDMIDKEEFHDTYKSDPMAAYKFISNNFNDHPLNFSTDDKIIKIELI